MLSSREGLEGFRGHTWHDADAAEAPIALLLPQLSQASHEDGDGGGLLPPGVEENGVPAVRAVIFLRSFIAVGAGRACSALLFPWPG